MGRLYNRRRSHDIVFPAYLQRLDRLYASRGENSRIPTTNLPRCFTPPTARRWRYYRNSGNRVYADYSEISQHVIDALIATEDARFEDHSGIDMRAFMRVLVKYPHTSAEECRRWFHHHPAACQAALQSLHKQYFQPCPPEAYRMDDSCEARALLLERRDSEDVSQPV